MAVPLLEPAMLVTDNCTSCRGTGTLRDGVTPCTDCEGSGREVREMPLTEAWERVRERHEQVTAQTPTAARAAALASVEQGGEFEDVEAPGD